MSKKRNLSEDLDSFSLDFNLEDNKPSTKKQKKQKRTPTRSKEQDDTFYSDMDELYETLKEQETHNTKKNISEIITEVEDAIKKKISEKNYPQAIIHYKNMLTNIKNLNETQKEKIEQIYNSDTRDKHNVIHAIINSDKIITAKPYTPYKSPNKTNKRKRGGNKSKKSNTKKNLKNKK